MIFPAIATRASTLTFSGTIGGTATEDTSGRCAPFVTVNATGSGTSDLLGNFTDVQGHCTTGPTTFNAGLFTLTSQSAPNDSFFGSYSGTASFVSGGVLSVSAALNVLGGTGSFAGATGALTSTGTLQPSGAFAANFNGSLTTAPEPAILLPVGLATMAALLVRTRKRQDHRNWQTSV